jgi:hypothetical protein
VSTCSTLDSRFRALDHARMFNAQPIAKPSTQFSAPKAAVLYFTAVTAPMTRRLFKEVTLWTSPQSSAALCLMQRRIAVGGLVFVYIVAIISLSKAFNVPNFRSPDSFSIISFLQFRFNRPFQKVFLNLAFQFSKFFNRKTARPEDKSLFGTGP